MKPNPVLFLFAVTAVVNLLGNGLESDVLVWWSKPLLMPLLGIWFWARLKDAGSLAHTSAGQLTRWMYVAFVCSWAGDVLLLFVGRPPLYDMFFLLGLGSFLLAHLGYIGAFRKLATRADSQRDSTQRMSADRLDWAGMWGVRMALLMTLAVLLVVLFPGMDGGMKAPVGLYGIVIVSMSLMAHNLRARIPRTAYTVLFPGSLLFILSDALIALDRFRFDIPFAGIAIMATYLLAQYWIALGVVRCVVHSTSPT